MLRRSLVSLGLMAVLLLPRLAEAHFLWVVAQPHEQAESVKVYFSESASPDDPALLERVVKPEAWAIGRGRTESQKLELRKGADALEADVPSQHRASPIVLRHVYGVISRGGETFLLNYHAKTYPSVLPGTWRKVSDPERLPFEIVPKLDGQSLALQVLWQGKPLGGATVTITGPGLQENLEGTTDERGAYRCELPQDGLFSIRAKHVEAESGEHEGQRYDSIRHYTTLSLRFDSPELAPSASTGPELPKGTTSFGGAIVGDWLYVYGGHYGAAHHYSREGQSGDFLRLNLRDRQPWEPLPGGPKLTGLAMVAHDGKLYRLGGFTAKNAESEEQSLWSQADFARFDPQTRQWESLPPLPEPRSSHDAAVLGDTLYVVGGWQLRGEKETLWHDTAWSMDLSSAKLQWRPVPQPPFKRRAVALAAWQGKLFCLGGMQEQGGPTTAVAIYDPERQQWSNGPALLGGGLEGFGSSAFAAGEALYATTMSGAVQRLSADGGRWEFAGQLQFPRFFHRLLPWQSDQLVVVGGASMAEGKLTALELVPAPARSARHTRSLNSR